MAVREREMVVLAPEPESRAAFSRIPDLHVLVRLKPEKMDRIKHLFVEISASMLPQVSDIVRAANETKYLRGLFIREDVDAKFLPQILQRADLRLMRNILVHGSQDWTTPERVMNAWRMGAENDLIASATVVGDHLYVLTSAFERLEVPFDKVAGLKSIPPEQRSRFEIDEVGSFLHWPESDVHIDVDVIRYAIDARWRTRCDLEKLTFDRNFGKAITLIRKRYNLRQSDFENLTDRQLRRIESGAARPSVATLKTIAKAHKLSLDDYLEALGNALESGGN